MTSSSETTWIEAFLARRPNRYLCEVDESYIEDAFNLTGLRPLIPNYTRALSIILDDTDETDELSYEQYKKAQKSAERLYGLIHARFVLTNRGLQRMMEKYQQGDFGHCGNPACRRHPLLPTAIADPPRQARMRLLCPNCEEMVTPEDTDLDGAYFGTSWLQMLFLVHPEVRPKKFPTRYEPRVFGFRVHPSAYEQPDRNASLQTKRRHNGKAEEGVVNNGQ